MKPNSRTQRLQHSDKRYLWHPFTQMKEWLESEPLVIESAEGCRLLDSEGNSYLDGVSSLWCNVHGHRHPRLDAALLGQANKVAHSTLLGLTNPPAIELAERLVELAPEGLTRVFYSENGASAVEVALKMAFQYWRNLGEKRRSRFVALELAYHGDTLGAVSVGGIEEFHAIYKPMLFEVLRAPTPYVYRSTLGSGDPESCRDACLSRLEATLEAHQEEVAAVIVEPLVQGAAGIVVHPDGFLAGVRDLCDRYGTLLICDEVATGFGKTARMFACEHESVSPDLMVLGKGITGGYLPLSATMCTEAIFEAFLGPYEEMKTFFHGHTYSGNPLACAVAIASLDVFVEERVLQSLPAKVTALADKLARFDSHPNVGDVRQKGLMAGVELVRDKLTKDRFDISQRVAWRISMAARKRGVVVRPLGDVLVFMPPLCISEPEISELVEAVYDSLEEVLPV
ncbi:MAG: adenosylmethionine--8-amino-7-oxononanoate transaminase [Acidimicrobiia bacterium]